MIGNGDRARVRQYDVSDSFVSAFVSPENLSAARVDCRHAVRPALNRLAVFQTRELTAGARVDNSSGEQKLWS